jgi:hypothetical protein
MKRKIIRRQRPVKGGRAPLPACVLHQIRAHVERLASQHAVSRSFVIATVLADAFGVAEQERFYPSKSGAVPIGDQNPREVTLPGNPFRRRKTG